MINDLFILSWGRNSVLSIAECCAVAIIDMYIQNVHQDKHEIIRVLIQLLFCHEPPLYNTPQQVLHSANLSKQYIIGLGKCCNTVISKMTNKRGKGLFILVLFSSRIKQKEDRLPDQLLFNTISAIKAAQEATQFWPGWGNGERMVPPVTTQLQVDQQGAAGLPAVAAQLGLHGLPKTAPATPAARWH